MRTLILAAVAAVAVGGGALCRDAGAQTTGPGSSPTGTSSPTLVSPLIQPTIAVSTTLDQAQASGGTTLLALASATGVAAGQVVQGPYIPLGDEVASLVATAQKTEAANGSFSSGQKVIPMSTTSGFAVGQQCTDAATGGSGVIGAGNVIASIQANTSITLTSNALTNSIGATDSITCDPVATLTAATTQAMPAAAGVQFITNHAVLSALAALYDPGDFGVAGNIMSGGSVGAASAFYNTNQTPPTVSSGHVWVGMIRGSSGAGYCTLEMVTSTNTQIIQANVAGGGC